MELITEASDSPVVFIVDDEASTRMFATEFLSQAGFQTEEASNGIEAFEKIDSVRPDLILLDVEMPGLNGFELCRAIRKKTQFAKTPILMLTGLNNSQSIEQAYEAGATDFATKPINWSLLCHRLRYMQRSAQAERNIHQLAYYDQLTGLPNRALFHERLQHAIDQAKLSNSQLAILYLDLDDFKRINDVFGHATGDQILSQIGNRVSDYLLHKNNEISNPNILLARMGGDEFTILLDDIDSESSAIRTARDILDLFAQPIDFNDNRLYSSPSVGISLFPRDGDTVDHLLTNADMAMYEAKKSGRNAYSVYDCSNEEEILQQHIVSSKMRDALEEETFTLHYQPQLNLATCEVYAAEALLRWTHAELGVVSPEVFIPLAEQNGLIVPLGEWVLRTACSEAKRWVSNDFMVQKVAVNISVFQFMQAGFVDVVASILEETQLAPCHLELEITESLLVTDVNNAVSTLNKLKNIGVELSIDDFGTGYSNLSQISNFPIDRLKVDKSFIRNVTANTVNAGITRAVIAMAKSLNVQVLAEGVETIDELHFLIDNGCNEIQGHLISEAKSAESLEKAEAEILNKAHDYLTTQLPLKKVA